MNEVGTEKRLEEIYRETSGFVFRNALRITGSVEEAEEVTQEVYIRMFKNLGKFRGNSDIKTWLYRITVNTAYNHIRAVKRRGNIIEHEHIVGNEPQTNDSPEERIKRLELKNFIKSALEKLPEELREAIYLREVEDMKYEDIAELLKENVNTIKTRIRRARERLAEILRGVEI